MRIGRGFVTTGRAATDTRFGTRSPLRMSLDLRAQSSVTPFAIEFYLSLHGEPRITALQPTKSLDAAAHKIIKAVPDRSRWRNTCQLCHY
jgi:hypothetical protein